MTVRSWFATIIVAGLALFGFGWGAHDLNQYRVGTPTTATVTACGGGGKMGGYCTGTWSIDGVPQTGDIEHGFIPPVGSSLDVRVSGGAAYTADASILSFGVGVLFTLVFVGFVWGRRRSGR
jgi:hypothetical protein